jgi:hypothetical protein
MEWGVGAGLWTSDPSEVWKDRNYGLDWNIVMNQANADFDQALLGHPTVRPDASELDDFQSRASRSRIVGDMFMSMLIPPFEIHAEACRRTICKENLLRITIAMLLYEKEHGTLPPAYSVDSQGRPLHSWRVLILPYLGHEELYSQIRLDEPWDSLHNQQFHVADVPIYQCPTPGHAQGMTSYAVVEGATCAFDGGSPRRLDSFGPESANLALVVERVHAACWMDPTQEIPMAEAVLGINRAGAATGLGGEHNGGLHVTLRSGAVRFVSENIAIEDLIGLLEGTLPLVP